MAMKIPVSFKENEKDLYEFLQSQMSPSIYIKELLKREMLKNAFKEDAAPTRKKVELDF